MLRNIIEWGKIQPVKRCATSNGSRNITLKEALAGNNIASVMSQERVEALIRMRRYTLERNSEGRVSYDKNSGGKNSQMRQTFRPATQEALGTISNFNVPKGFVMKMTQSLRNKLVTSHSPRRGNYSPSYLRRTATGFVEKVHPHIKDSTIKPKYSTCKQRFRREHLRNCKSTVRKEKVSVHRDKTTLKSMLTENRYRLIEGRAKEIEAQHKARERFMEHLESATSLKGMPLNYIRNYHQSSQLLLLRDPKTAEKYSQHLDFEVQLRRSCRENFNKVSDSLSIEHGRLPISLNSKEQGLSAEKINENFEEQYQLKMKNMLHVARSNLKEIEKKNKIITQKFNQSQPKIVSDFFYQAKYGDIHGIKKMLEDHPELVKERDNIGLTALHSAAKTGNVELVRLLVKFGSDISSVDIFKRTPSKIAKKYNQIKVVRYFKELEINLKLQKKAQIQQFSDFLQSKIEKQS